MILIGTLFIVTVVFVIPGAAIIGAVYAQYLMETRPPRGPRHRRVVVGAPALRAEVVPERA